MSETAVLEAPGVAPDERKPAKKVKAPKKRPRSATGPKKRKEKDKPPTPKEVREGAKPGVYVHIIRLLMKATKQKPLTDATCFEALKKVKSLKERFATEEGADGIEKTMKDSYRRTLKTRMGWPVVDDGKDGPARGFWMKGGEKARSSDEFQQRKWERLNTPKKAK